MVKRWFGWVLLLTATVFNLAIFLRRWSEPPSQPFALLFTDAQVASASVGVGLGIVFVAFVGSVWARRWISALAVAGLSVGLVWWFQEIPAFSQLFPPIQNWALGGAVAALICCRVRESEVVSGTDRLGSSFALFTLASLNFFLLAAPLSSHVPSYVQDSIDPQPTLRLFYYGSVHSDLSQVSILMRAIINSFFDSPSINATALSSMAYVSVALALCAISIQMIFGSGWGWLVLFLAWTDRWIFASAISSAIIGQPVLSVAIAIFLCAWALSRPARPLSWLEAVLLGAFSALGVLYNLYSYSAARMPWLVGCGIAALILAARRAVWLNADGAKKVCVAVVPSIALLVFIWATVFDRDTDYFKGQIFISPKMGQLIKDVNDYPIKVTAIHDNDVPIWWGTGRPEGENVSVYWRRTPKEVLDKVMWFLEQLAFSTPLPSYLVFLGALGLIVGVSSAIPKWRCFVLVLLGMTVVSFAPFILAQDPSAYRRALATDLLVLLAVISLFAVKARRGIMKGLAVSVCGALAIVKAPSELNELTNQSFYSPVCIICQGHIDIRKLVNDAAYRAVAHRPLRILARGNDVAPFFSRCFLLSIESNEFKQLSPLSEELILGGRTLRQAFTELKAGEILVVPCSPSTPSDPDMGALCRGTAPFGKHIATVPTVHEGMSAWWALVER